MFTRGVTGYPVGNLLSNQRELRIDEIREKYQVQRAPLYAEQQRLKTELSAISLEDEDFNEKTISINNSLVELTEKLNILSQAEAAEIRILS